MYILVVFVLGWKYLKPQVQIQSDFLSKSQSRSHPKSEEKKLSIPFPTLKATPAWACSRALPESHNSEAHLYGRMRLLELQVLTCIHTGIHMWGR